MSMGIPYGTPFRTFVPAPGYIGASRSGVAAEATGGTLTQAERRALQNVADEFQTEIDVVGSRAAGQGRNIHTNLPVGKVPRNATRSDIDIRYDGQLEIDTGGGLTNALKNIGVEDLIDARPRLPGGTEPPFIRIGPRKQ